MLHMPLLMQNIAWNFVMLMARAIHSAKQVNKANTQSLIIEL